MGVRGVYHSWDQKNGIWIHTPNIFTAAGWDAILKIAFQAETTPVWSVGLCSATPFPVMVLADMGEPSGSGGYARQTLSPRSATNWPTVGVVENESYVLSKEFTFPHSGGAYSASVNRLFMIDADDNIISVSSAFPESIIYSVASTHRYQLYFR